MIRLDVRNVAEYMFCVLKVMDELFACYYSSLRDLGVFLGGGCNVGCVAFWVIFGEMCCVLGCFLVGVCGELLVLCNTG
jgi:hypothetical protein